MSTTALIDVTPLAAEKIEKILKDEKEDGTMLRVMVVPGPQGGFEYKLGVETEAKDDDFVIETGLIRVLVDAESAPLIEGSQIDYVEDLMKSGFVISKPNAQGACGCGGGGC